MLIFIFTSLKPSTGLIGGLKGHLQPVCIAVVHLTENHLIHVLIVFENQNVSLQFKAIAGFDTLLKRNIDTDNPVIKHRNHVRDF